MTESRRVRPPRARAARIRGVLAWSEPRAGGTIPYLAAKLTCPAESTSMMTPGLVSRSQARTQQAALDARDASYSATTSLAAGPREPMYRPTMSSGRVGGLVSCRYHPATGQSGRVLVSATIRTWRSLYPWSSASASSRSRSSTPGWSRSRTASIALAWLMASDQPTFTGQTPVGPPQPRGSEQAAPATTVGSPRRSGGLLGHRFRTQSRAGCGARFRWRGGFGAGPLDASGDDPAPRRALPAKARHWRAAPRLAGQSQGRALPPAPRPVVACLERSRRPQAAIPPRWPPAGGEPARRGHTPAVGAGYAAPRPGPSPAATTQPREDPVRPLVERAPQLPVRAVRRSDPQSERHQARPLDDRPGFADTRPQSRPQQRPGVGPAPAAEPLGQAHPRRSWAVQGRCSWRPVSSCSRPRPADPW